MNEKIKGTIWVTICYIVALAGAWLTILFFPTNNHIISVLAADIVATAIVFAFSTFFRNASFYDPYWSVAPVLIALFWKYTFGGSDWALSEILAFTVLCFWAVRLTANWYRGWAGITHEDWRYQQLNEQNGKLYPLVNFFGIHLFPTLIVFLGCLPLVAVFSYPVEQMNIWLILACVIGVFAPVLQWFADEQMRVHRNSESPGKSYIQIGVWRYSRHPNYFGEILFWVSMALFGNSTGEMVWWMYSGVLAMFLLFWFISIPLMEKRIIKKYPDYVHEQKSVSRLVLWFRKKG